MHFIFASPPSSLSVSLAHMIALCLFLCSPLFFFSSVSIKLFSRTLYKMWNDNAVKVKTIAHDKLLRSTDKMYHAVGFRLGANCRIHLCESFRAIECNVWKCTQMPSIFIESQNNTSGSSSTNIKTMLIAIPYKKLLIEFNWDYASEIHYTVRSNEFCCQQFGRLLWLSCTMKSVENE